MFFRAITERMKEVKGSSCVSIFNHDSSKLNFSTEPLCRQCRPVNKKGWFSIFFIPCLVPASMKTSADGLSGPIRLGRTASRWLASMINWCETENLCVETPLRCVYVARSQSRGLSSHQDTRKLIEKNVFRQLFLFFWLAVIQIVFAAGAKWNWKHKFALFMVANVF